MSRTTLVLLIILCGCSFEDFGFEKFALRNVPEGPSLSWRYGYADGCWSGRHGAGSHKQLERDVARFRSDDQYRDGWETGYRDCLGRTQNETTTPTAELAMTETPPPTPSPQPTADATRAPASTSSAERAAERRAEIENRIRELRGEIQSLEAELRTLPK